MNWDIIKYSIESAKSLFTASQARRAEYQRKIDYHKLLKVFETQHQDMIDEFTGYIQTYYPSLYQLSDKEVEARATECYHAWLEFITYR